MKQEQKGRIRKIFDYSAYMTAKRIYILCFKGKFLPFLPRKQNKKTNRKTKWY